MDHTLYWLELLDENGEITDRIGGHDSLDAAEAEVGVWAGDSSWRIVAQEYALVLLEDREEVVATGGCS